MTNPYAVAGGVIDLVGVALAGLEFWLFPPDARTGQPSWVITWGCDSSP